MSINFIPHIPVKKYYINSFLCIKLNSTLRPTIPSVRFEAPSLSLILLKDQIILYVSGSWPENSHEVQLSMVM